MVAFPEFIWYLNVDCNNELPTNKMWQFQPGLRRTARPCTRTVPFLERARPKIIFGTERPGTRNDRFRKKWERGKIFGTRSCPERGRSWSFPGTSKAQERDVLSTNDPIKKNRPRETFRIVPPRWPPWDDFGQSFVGPLKAGLKISMWTSNFEHVCSE